MTMADDGLLAQFDAQHGTKPDAATNGAPDLLAAFDKSLTAKPFGPGNPPPGAMAVQVPQPTLLSRLGDLLASTHEIPVVSGVERGAAAGGLDLAGGIENLVGGVPAAVGGALGHPELGDRFFQTGDYLRDLANQVAAAGPQTGAAGATQDITRGLAHYALGPELAAGAAATNAAAEGAQSGAPLGQQFKNAALEGALAEAGGRIPIAGKTLPAKLAAGAGLGLAFPFAEHAGQHYLVGNENVAPLPSLGELATSEAMMLALPALHAGGSKLADMARGNASTRVQPPPAAPANDASTVEAALRASGLFTDAQIRALKSDGSLGDIAAAATPGPRLPLAGPAPEAPLPVAAVRALPGPEPHQPAPLALPPPPRQLPPPTIAVDRAGNAVTNAQAMDAARAADAAAQERASLGLTPDVQRARTARIESLLARERAGVGPEPPVPPIPEGRFPEAAAPVAEAAPVEPARKFRPMRAQNGQIMRDAKGRPLREPVLDFSRDHLLHWLAANGGINFKSLRESADVDPALLKDAGVMRPFGRLGDPALRRNGGMTVDQAVERMQEAGWLPQNDPNAPPKVGNDDATSMILDALNGHEITHPVEGVDERLQRRAAEHYADEARHEAAMAEDRAAQTEAERTHDLQALREHNAQFADADAGEALTVHQWIQRARDAGVPDESIRDALSREDWTPTLNRLIQERGNGTDTGATAVDLGRGNAPAGEGQVAEPGPAPHGPERGAAVEASEGRRGDLFPAATGAERIRAAREAKDAERNGLNRPQQPFTNTDLGATPRGGAPEQARIPEGTEPRRFATQKEAGMYAATLRGDARVRRVTEADGKPAWEVTHHASQDVLAHAEPVHEVAESDLSPADRELVQRTRARAAQAQDNRAVESALEQDSRARGEREAGELGLRGAVVEALGPDRMQNVHFVHDEDGLPESVRKRGMPIKRGNVRYGLHTPNGHSYIFTKHANTPERAAWTAIHEVGGHEGVAALVREHPDVKLGNRTLREAYESARKLFLQNPTVAKLADVIGKQRASTDAPRMAEEAMAELQAAKRSGRWDEIARKYGVDVPKSVRDGVQGAMANFARRMKAIVNAIYRKLTGAKGDGFIDADVHDMLDRMWEAARGEHAGVGEQADQQVFHGTPHRGIEREGFKLNKIGTGEGAQAYGWGVYFAGRRQIAEQYRERLSTIPTEAEERRMEAAINAAMHTGATRNEALSVAQRVRAARMDGRHVDREGRVPGTNKDAADLSAAFDAAEHAFGQEPLDRRGQLYHAEIPEDKDLLDWDKPLAEQSPKVLAKLEAIGKELPDWAHEQLAEHANADWSDLTGREAYQFLSRLASEGELPRQHELTTDNGHPAQAASEFLNAHGIPGLRYLDGGSRGSRVQEVAEPDGPRWIVLGDPDAGEFRTRAEAERHAADTESHNYVIWDEAHLNNDVTPYYSEEPASHDMAFVDAAKKYFGTTNDAREAGYIMPDGSMLDFTGRHYSSDHPSLRGHRNVDHRELTGENMQGASLDDFFRTDGGSGSDYMQEFMDRTGAMRVDSRSGVASVMGEPTPAQVRQLSQALRGDYAALSVIDPKSGRIIDEAEIEGPTPQKIARFFARAKGKAADDNAPLFSEEPAERDLIAQHNTTAEKLAHADRMGGMAVPSIAVTRAGHPLEDFGDISLIGNKDIVDPHAGAKVFGADAYTPRYPDVKFKSDRDVALNVARIIGKRDGERLEVEAVGNAEDLTHSDAFKRYAEERLGNDYTYHEARALAENVLREAGAKELLFKGYTNAGYRRYVPHTLENVVKELKRNLRGGEGFNYGPGSVRAKFTPQFRSIEKIRAEKGRLMSKADFEAVKKNVDDDFFKVLNELSPYHDIGNELRFTDTVTQTMQDAAHMGIDRALRENGFEDVPSEARAKLAEFLTHLKHLPTHYFEAIQPRAVGIHEFKSAVVPSDATPETRALLQRHGLNIHEYERGNPEDRQRAIREAAENDDLLFSEEPQDRADTFGRGAGGAAVPEPVVEMPPRAPGESQKAYHARVIRESRAIMLDGIKATVGLRTWTPEEKAQQTIGRGGMRAMWAKNQRAADKAAAAFHQAQRVFDKAGKSANLEAIHQWETGADIASASHRLFFKAMQAEFQKRIDAIRAISPGTLDHVIENYFPHLWEDPIKAGKWYQREFGKRPLEGNKSFLKQRVHATMKDGMAAGLKPVSTNPVDLVLAKMAQMDKFLALHEFRKDLQDRGWLKEMEPGERVPYGYARVDDPAFVKAAGLQGYFAVPEPIARDLNNYLSPSLYRFAPFKAFRRLQNLVMMARLGWSAFHAGFTTLDNLVMHADVGVRYALDGDIKRALITWAKTPLSVVWSPIEGGKLNRQWLGLDKADANTAALLDALEQGGAHYKMDTSEYNQGLRRFIRAFQQKDYGKSARAALSAAGETGSWIIHHKLVPNQKMAARLLLAKSALDRVAGKLGKDRGDYAGIIEAMHPDALRQIMGDVVKNVDDRLGQMNYDNQFWNKTAREAAQAMIGAVGWQVGTVRTVTGGVRDLQRLWSPEKLVSALDKDGKITDADMGRVTGRLTYLVSLALIMGGGNAALQYMMTGKGPSELKDYFFPKTGNKNADGSDERLQLPTYWMDHYKLATHPLQTAEHKIHPVFSMIMEAIANQDYWGVEIHDPHASWAKQAEQIGEYVAKGFLPYSVTNNQKARANEAGAGRQAASFFGVTTAPASVSRSKFQSFVAHNGNKGFGHEKRTAVDAEHSRTIKDIENQIRNGGEPDLSGLNRKDLLRVRRESREEVPEIQFKKMDIEDKLDAWDMATPKERKEYHLRRDILTSRGTQTVRFRRLPADERHAVLERILQVRDARSE